LDRKLVRLVDSVPLTDESRASEAAGTLDLQKLDEQRLRGREMGEAASLVSGHSGVRAALLDLQRRFAAQPGGAVLDGRDIGTVICPSATVKLFLTASPQERARRRRCELASRGEPADYEAILDDIHRRDDRDRSRATAPLRPAGDAFLLDTTMLDAEAAFRAALALVEEARARA